MVFQVVYGAQPAMKKFHDHEPPASTESTSIMMSSLMTLPGSRRKPFSQTSGFLTGSGVGVMGSSWQEVAGPSSTLTTMRKRVWAPSKLTLSGV